MSQQTRAIETRAALIRGAAEVFQSIGYGEASLSMICDAAGVTKGALYFHFRSKEEVAAAVVAAQHGASIDVGMALLDGDARGVDAFVKMSMLFARQIRTDAILRAGIRLTLEGAAFSIDVAEPYRTWVAAGAAYLRRGMEDGDLRADLDPEDAGRFVIAAFTGVQQVSEVLEERADLYTRVEQMWAYVFPAIARPERLADVMALPAAMRRLVETGTQ